MGNRIDYDTKNGEHHKFWWHMANKSQECGINLSQRSQKTAIILQKLPLLFAGIMFSVNGTIAIAHTYIIWCMITQCRGKKRKRFRNEASPQCKVADIKNIIVFAALRLKHPEVFHWVVAMGNANNCCASSTAMNSVWCPCNNQTWVVGKSSRNWRF